MMNFETKIQHAICDTVALQIDQQDFKITNPDLFEPNANFIFNYHGKGKISAFQCMTTQDKQQQHYKPKLALRRQSRVGGSAISLYIELSLPKLVYGNNLQEVTDDDFDIIIRKLKDILAEMGVEIETSVLINAHVSRFHSCKNVILEQSLSTLYVISQIAKEDLARLSNGQTNYQNGGYCARFRTNEYEIAVYDKIADIKQLKASAKKCVDYDAHREIQHIDIDKYEKLQVLRLEIRLNSAKIIHRKLEEAGVTALAAKPEITFRDIFNSEVTQKLNVYFWKKICVSGKIIFCLKDTAKTIWHKLSPNTKDIKKLEIIGLAAMINECGVSYMKNLVGKNATIIKLFSTLKNYEPDNLYDRKVYCYIGKKLVKNEVIKLPQPQD